MRTYLASDTQTYSARSAQGAAVAAYGRGAVAIADPFDRYHWEVTSSDMGGFLGDIWEQ